MPSRRKTSQSARADVFTVIAHPVRRDILALLVEGDANATELSAPFEISRSAVSQHLSILLDSGLVTMEQHGREHTFALRPDGLIEVYAWMSQFEQFWPDKLDALGELLDSVRDTDEEPGKDET